MLQAKKIRVLTVDDSIFFRKMLIDNLSKFENIEVVGYAINAYDAKNKIPALKPDVVTLDVEMPGMSGIDFLKQLMRENPVPVILVSSLNLSVFDALSAGAVDFVRKPDMSSDNSFKIFISDLYRKITIASNAKVRLHNTPAKTAMHSILAHNFNPPKLKLDSMIIAIGASTGGTEATLSILKQLPANMPGIVVTQHMPPGFTKMYADRLDRICKITVKEAKNGDQVLPGRALIAPGDKQMKVVKVGTHYTVSCLDGEKVSGHKPSVDVLFNSVADAAGPNAIGVILTGMGRDGASGLLKMRQKGAYTIGQNKETCVVYGMPMVAYNIGAVCIQAACENISDLIIEKLK